MDSYVNVAQNIIANIAMFVTTAMDGLILAAAMVFVLRLDTLLANCVEKKKIIGATEVVIFLHALLGIVFMYAPEHIYNEVGHSPRKLCR